MLCNHIAIGNHGQIVAHDATPKLLARMDRKDVIVTLEADVAAVLAKLQAAGLAIHDLTTQDAGLEDLFVELTRSRAA